MWIRPLLFIVYLYVFGVLNFDVRIIARYSLVDCPYLLPKETFTLVFDPYGLLQSNGQTDITFEAVVIDHCVKLDMWQHYLYLLLNHWNCITDYSADGYSYPN